MVIHATFDCRAGFGQIFAATQRGVASGKCAGACRHETAWTTILMNDGKTGTCILRTRELPMLTV
ncbi:MAG: hypothetical protein P4M00_01690 [Azospirillaceae bacterium]|nr:hypothetical protein [Azospirillaceae bacterium]